MTKFAQFIPTVIIVIASGVAILFIKHIFENHGLCSKIISNRDRKYISEFWSSFFKLYK